MSNDFDIDLETNLPNYALDPVEQIDQTTNLPDYALGSTVNDSFTPDNSAIAETIQLALGSDAPTVYSGGSTPSVGGYPKAVANDGTSLLQDVKTTAGKWFDGTMSFLSDPKNKKLSELALSAVVGMAQGSAAKEAAAIRAKSDMAVLDRKAALEQEANQRFSDSVSGLRAPGLIGKQKPLTRMDGSRVFSNNGLLAKA